MKRFLFACLMFLAAAPAMAQTVVSFASTPGDSIGQGQTKAFTTANSTVLQFSGTRNAIHVLIHTKDGDAWNLDLVAPVGEELMPGKYLDAENASFVNGRAPGLNFYGAGRSCSKVSGEFAIRQVKFDTAGNLSRLEGTALQYCGTSTSPLALEVRYRASYYMFGVESTKPHFLGPVLKQNYYNDTSVLQGDGGGNWFSLRASGLKAYWNISILLPPGQAQFTKGSFQTTVGIPQGQLGTFDISANGSACNGLAGTVNVLEVAYGPNNRMDKFYADFTRYCGPVDWPPLKGRIRWVRGI